MVDWKIIAFSVIGIVILVFVIYSLNKPDNVDYSAVGNLEDCENIMFSGIPDNKIDILFIPNNYDNPEKFVKDVEVFMDTFFSLVPFKGNEERFNFFILNDFDEELDCTYDEAILCNPNVVKKVASRCVYDYPVVVTDVNGVTDLFERLRSSAWQGSVSVSNKDLPWVFPHEFAHVFSYLADEYIVPGARMTWDPPNCVADETCERFKEVEGTDCHQGCMLLNYYRDPYNGLMKDYYSSDGRTYGPYNEHVLRNDMLAMSNVKIAPSMEYKPEEIYVINAKYKDGNVVIEEVTKSIGFSPKYSNGYGVQFGEKVVNVPVPNLIFTDGYGEGTIQALDEADFVVILPADEVGDSNFGTFLNEKGEKVGTIRFNENFFSYPISKEIITNIPVQSE